jgi:hypothetical protein
MKKLLLAFICLGKCLPLLASNSHEHLFSLPFKEDLVILYQEDAADKCSVTVADIFTSEAAWKSFMKIKSPAHEEDYQEIKDAPFYTLLTHLNLSPRALFTEFFSLDDIPKRAFNLKKLAYVSIENVRKSLLMDADVDTFLKVYTHYFEKEPLINRKTLSVTATKRFFTEKNLNKAVLLQHLAKKLNSHLVYRVSLPRHRLIKEGVYFSAHIESLFAKGLIAGIDVVCSMHEAVTDGIGQEILIENRIKELFKYCQERNLVAFLHAFEGANSGPFYTALRRAIEDLSSPLTLEIGHANTITEEWLEFFQKQKQLQLAIHMCPASGKYLQGVSKKHFQSIAKAAEERKLPVFLGSDGRGILLHSSFMEQKKWLGMQCNYNPAHKSPIAHKKVNASAFHSLLVGQVLQERYPEQHY